jgi:hypothetical protein
MSVLELLELARAHDRQRIRRAAAFSRAVHFAAGFMGTGAVILSQQHVMTPPILKHLTFRCFLAGLLWGLVWEFFVQGVIADLKPNWKWTRKPDLAAAAAFPLGAAVAVAVFVLWVTR